jgi:hypothetical protein
LPGPEHVQEGGEEENHERIESLKPGRWDIQAK